MLKINKYIKDANLTYNFYTLQPKVHNILYKLQKTKQSIVSLRSPRNFSVGKYKVYSLNFRLKLKLSTIITNYHLYSFLNYKDSKFLSLTKNLTLFKLNKVKTIKISVYTTFKFIWLQ